MAKVTANNILSGSINTDKLDSSVVNNLTTATTANNTATSALATAQAAYNSANTTGSSLSNLPPVISSITITDSSYNVLDDTAANTTGGYCVITGSGFVSGATVIFGTTSASAVTFANSTSLRVQVPTLSAASYPTYVVNPSGATAIKINGLTTSSFPAWGTAATLANTAANAAFSVSLSANSDSNITYSNTSALPAGTSLLANGYFYGTVTVGTETTYTFTVDARDAEYQNALRTFSMTVTVTPPSKYMWSWGYNQFGQLGSNNKVYRSSPAQIGALGTWSKISVSKNGYTSGAIKTDGTLWLWGNPNSGMTALSNLQYRSSPTQVGALTNWSTLGLGTKNTAATKTDGTLWTWGLNTTGQLGTNDIVSRSSPVQVGSDTNWASAIGSQDIAFAIKTNGTLWAWGSNSVGTGTGALGLNDQVNRSSPVQIGTDTNWSSISSGKYSAFAIKTNGTLWGWGQNYYGELGKNDKVLRSSPVQIGALTNWSKVAADLYVIATKTDGTLWAWGNSAHGALGTNDTVYRSSPVQIGAGTTWNLVSASGYNSGATKSDGTLWIWGQSFYGIAGNNTERSSPVQVGAGTNWIDLNVSYHVLALST